MYMRLLNRMYILYLIVNCNYIHLILDLGVRIYIYYLYVFYDYKAVM